jgi:hypothetical protein
VGIKEGIDQQVTPYRLEGIAIGKRRELRRKTFGCKRYKVEEGLFKGL